MASTASSVLPASSSTRRRNGDAIAVHSTRAADHRTGPHTDATAVLLYIERGSGWYRQGERTIEVGPGSVSLLLPGDVHDVTDLRSTRGWIVEFRLDATGVLIAAPRPAAPPSHPPWTILLRPACLHGPLTVPPAARPRWEQRLRDLAHELHARPTGYGNAAQAYLTLMLVELARLSFPALDGPGQRREPILADVFAALDARYAEPLTIEQIARDVALSPRHLSRIVRRLTGQTVMSWLRDRRMAEARRLLLETEAPVERVAAHVGYRDAGHFRRQFRRMHGEAPTAWRRHMRRGDDRNA